MLMRHQSRRMFESLDFYVDKGQSSSSGSTGEIMLYPPSIDPASPEGKRTRAKLLRAWVEISSWLTLYHKNRPSKYAT